MLNRVTVHRAVAGGGIDWLCKGPGHAGVIRQTEPKFKAGLSRIEPALPQLILALVRRLDAACCAEPL
jgi:hypothetical protein